MFDGGGGTQIAPMSGLGMIEPVEERLKRRRKEMANSLEDIDKAIALLEKQPELLETLNLLRKVGI